jgi:thiamine-phosphate pyrophosphorylase
MIVHLVTDARGRTGSSDPRVIHEYVVALASEAIEAELDAVQVREPALDAGPLVTLARDLVSRATGSRTRIIINDRLDVAIAASAGGVHLKEQSIPPLRARTMTAEGFHIGRSVHAVESRQETAGSDYLIAGTVWPTRSKSEGHPTIGVEGLRSIVTSQVCPVLAIGGVTMDRVKEVARAGAAGIAAIGLFVDLPPGRLRGLAQELRQRFDTLA